MDTTVSTSIEESVSTSNTALDTLGDSIVTLITKFETANPDVNLHALVNQPIWVSFVGEQKRVLIEATNEIKTVTVYEYKLKCTAKLQLSDNVKYDLRNEPFSPGMPMPYPAITNEAEDDTYDISVADDAAFDALAGE